MFSHNGPMGQNQAQHYFGEFARDEVAVYTIAGLLFMSLT